jgi:hypothetical protein
VQIRYHIDPSTGLPHIYQHNVAENEVIRGRDDSRVAIGQTIAGRYLRVIYVADPAPDSVFVITAYELGPKGQAGHTPQEKEETMTTERYPRGWNKAKVQRVLEHYESQTDEEVAAEIEIGLNSTTMEVPRALVPVVRELIAKRKTASTKKTHNTTLQTTNRAGSKSKLRKSARAVRG